MQDSIGDKLRARNEPELLVGIPTSPPSVAESDEIIVDTKPSEEIINLNDLSQVQERYDENEPINIFGADVNFPPQKQKETEPEPESESQQSFDKPELNHQKISEIVIDQSPKTTTCYKDVEIISSDEKWVKIRLANRLTVLQVNKNYIISMRQK